jgi:hypothetical protein
MQTHQFDILGILKAFVIVLSITSASAAFAATLKESSYVLSLGAVHFVTAEQK